VKEYATKRCANVCITDAEAVGNLKFSEIVQRENHLNTDFSSRFKEF
jgi:hypothetical protein